MNPAHPRAAVLSIASLEVDDPDLHIRAGRDPEHLANVVEAYREGVPVPPIVVVHDGSTFRVVDGFYRVKAALLAGLAELPAVVRIGTKRDAILLACGMNAQHLGLPRSNADKRRAVEVLLADAEWKAWSNGAIAKVCAVSAPFVANVREKVTPNVSSERRYRTKHGSEATMQTRQIGKRAEKPAHEEEEGRGRSIVVPRREVTALLAKQPEGDLKIDFDAGGRVRLSIVRRRREAA